MTPELSHRLAQALSLAQPPVTIQQRIIVAEAADPSSVKEFVDLPLDVQQFILRLEAQLLVQ